MKLVIVESPAKCNKLAQFLGDGWTVEACRGHVRDLPETALGVDIGRDFHAEYAVLPGKGTLVKRLVKAMHEADAVYLATDPDREGEAIAWHLLELAGDLRGKPVYRAAFNAITESAVKAALDHPRAIDTALVEAQSARRIVDRLVGYLVSPVACKALDGKLSAGRVQSVALRLVVEREREIEAFKPQTTYSLNAMLEADGVRFDAKLYRLKDAEGVFSVRDQAEKLVAVLKEASFWVSQAGKSLKLRNAPPPFTTSSLQQVASNALGLSPDRTMAQAQKLYEQGRITYHRTDSVAVAPEAQTAAREIIEREYGADYLPAEAPIHRAKSANAQEAHEAIRPTDVHDMPQDDDLYALIWKRFVASQMSPAQYTVTGALIHAGKSPDKPFPVAFTAQGSERVFDGYLRVYMEEEDEPGASVPLLRQGQALQLVDLPIAESQTRPPTRFSEAGLVQALERQGVGRPSTYASTLGTLKRKEYVALKEKRLVPTETGMKLCDFVVERFPQVFDAGYTARLEAALDRVASGEATRSEVLSAFWQAFLPQLNAALKTPVVLHAGD